MSERGRCAIARGATGVVQADYLTGRHVDEITDRARRGRDDRGTPHREGRPEGAGPHRDVRKSVGAASSILSQGRNRNTLKEMPRIGEAVRANDEEAAWQACVEHMRSTSAVAIRMVDHLNNTRARSAKQGGTP